MLCLLALSIDSIDFVHGGGPSQPIGQRNEETLELPPVRNALVL